MPVQLPTAADVRRAREQGADAARTPLLAVLGAGDYAYSTVTKAVTTARVRAGAQAEEAQHRVAALPRRFTPEALRALAEELRTEAEERYGYLARRGESTWGRLRKQPQVRHVVTTLETYTERLDARVDGFVDDAQVAAEKALATVTRQTRSRGEKAARATQRLAGDAARTVAAATQDASAAVAEAGTETAETITEVGDEAASTTRSTTRRTANRTAPKTEESKTETKSATKALARKPAARTAGGSK